MRTRLTNILQAVVLLTGIIYIFIGVLFFYSPVKFFGIFSVDVPEDWFKIIEYDSFIAPLYFIARSFAAMFFTSGVAMILPLYDPLKYRGLIYYMGIVFPLLSIYILLYNGIKSDHLILIILGIAFLIILLATSFALIITRKEARAGVE